MKKDRNPEPGIRNPKVLVTGANGQLGSELRALAGRYPCDCTFADRNDLDLADTEAVETYFENRAFDAIVNCAAYTAVDRAESDEAAADAVNHRAVATLARIAKAKTISLIHISTDYVFDGTNFRPYVETDGTNPQSVYGRTKRDGEEAMLAVNPENSMIIRTSWVYSSYGGNFVKTMLRLGKERDELGVIFDQVGTPTYARDLAQAILTIIRGTEHVTRNTEIYNYSNEGVCSWYDFAKAIFELSGVACNVRPIETKEYPTPAARPHYSLLNKAKIKKEYNIGIPHWRESLKVCLEEIGRDQF